MKVAFLTQYNLDDKHSWSGSIFHIRKCLELAGAEVIPLDNLEQTKLYNLLRLKGKLYRKFYNKRLLVQRHPRVLKALARSASRRLQHVDCDLIFSPGIFPIAYLKSDKPILTWTDATFGGMIDYYEEFKGLTPESLDWGTQADHAGIRNSTVSVYSADWARQTAIELHGADPRRAHVVAFGANVPDQRSIADIKQILEEKSWDICRLLFIGVDWVRKGGDLAVAVAQSLIDKGIPTELHIVGCTPPRPLPSFAKLHGFLSKKNPNDVNKLDSLFRAAHFFILPSVAECFGVVFCEASSYGLCSFATQTGGIPSAVAEGKNGWTFKLGSGPEPYTARIEALWADHASFNRYSEAAFQEYTTRLSWPAAAKGIAPLLLEAIELGHKSTSGVR